jgi:hypothetical protein
MLAKLLSVCRRHVARTTVVVVGIEIALAVIIWYAGGGRATFQALNNYIFLCLSVVIASLAAIGSIFASMSAHDSLTLTQKSLELARATQRPFLTARTSSIRLNDDHGEVFLVVTNTGSLPADRVFVEMTLWTLDSKAHERVLGAIKQDNAIYFPQANHKMLITVTKQPLKLIREEKTGVRLTMKYQHKLGDESFETITTWNIAKETGSSNYSFKLDPQKSHWS